MLDAEIGFCGLFQLTARNAETDEVTRQTPWFHNVVLDQGLDGMADNSWFGNIVLGTGGGEPTADQTDLVARFAVQNSTLSENSGVTTEGNKRYFWTRRTARFNAGVFDNTILAEVGILMANNALWNRALLRDINGNATTMTLAKNEYLDVSVEVRCYMDMDEVPGSFELRDKNGTLLQTVQTTRWWIRGDTYWGSDFFFSKGSVRNWLGFSTRYKGNQFRLWKTVLSKGDLPLPYENPNTAVGTFTVDPYVSGSHQLTFRNDFGLNTLNGDIVGGSITTINGVPGWFFKFEPPITKDNTQTLTVTGVYRWGRYVAG